MLQASGRDCPGSFELRIRARVADCHLCAVGEEVAGEVLPFDAKRVDDDPLAGEVGGKVGGSFLSAHHAGTANAKATPSTAAPMPTSQKRVTTCVSAQPISSKWWWSGARLKTRFPPLSL